MIGVAEQIDAQAVFFDELPVGGEVVRTEAQDDGAELLELVPSL